MEDPNVTNTIGASPQANSPQPSPQFVQPPNLNPQPPVNSNLIPSPTSQHIVPPQPNQEPQTQIVPTSQTQTLPIAPITTPSPSSTQSDNVIPTDTVVPPAPPQPQVFDPNAKPPIPTPNPHKAIFTQQKTKTEEELKQEKQQNKKIESSVSKAYKIKRRRTTIPIIATLLLLFTGLISGLTYAVAYEKLPFDIPKEFEQKTQHLVMALPFAPKNPKYVLEKAVLAQKNISRYSFDTSLSMQASEFTDIFDTSRFDMQFTGQTDFTNIDDISLEVDGSITKDFSFNFKGVDNFIYFKINQLPQVFFSMFDISKSDISPFLNRWVSHDVAPLETQASQYLEENNKPEENNIDEQMKKIFKYLTSDEVLEKITISEDTINGAKVHKLHLDVDQQLVKDFSQEIYDIFNMNYEIKEIGDYVVYENFIIDIWIDQDAYYPVKFASNLKIVPNSNALNSISDQILGESISSAQILGDSTFTSNPEITIAFVTTLSNIGQEVVIEIPASTTPFEDYILDVQQFMMEQSQAYYSGQILDSLPTELDSTLQNFPMEPEKSSGFESLLVE